MFNSDLVFLHLPDLSNKGNVTRLRKKEKKKRLFSLSNNRESKIKGMVEVKIQGTNAAILTHAHLPLQLIGLGPEWRVPDLTLYKETFESLGILQSNLMGLDWWLAITIVAHIARITKAHKRRHFTQLYVFRLYDQCHVLLISRHFMCFMTENAPVKLISTARISKCHPELYRNLILFRSN